MKSLEHKLLLLASLMLITAGSHAANWREVGEVPETGTIVSVDDGSLTVDHDIIVKGLVRFEFEKPRVQDGYKLDAVVSQRMVNCEVNRYWQLDAWGYRDNAEPVRLYNATQEWQTPAPDSESEIASAVLCNETQSIFGIVWGNLAIAHRLRLAWQALTAALGL